MIVLSLSLLLALVALATVIRRYDRRLVGYAAGGLALHVFSAFGQLWMIESYYGVGDIHMFAEAGKPIARALDLDFVQFAPEVLKMALHMDANLFLMRIDGSDSTSTMIAITGTLIFLLGNSMLIAFIFTSLVAWVGQVFLAVAIGDVVRAEERPLGYGAALLVPSVVFWSSGIVKEGFVIAALGLLVFSAHRVLAQRRLHYVVGIVVGAVTVAMLKPYVLFPLVAGLAGWVVTTRLGKEGAPALRLGPVVAATVVAVAGILIIGKLFPEFSVERLGERTAAQQQVWAEEANTSTFEMASGADSSLASQLPYVPLALVNSLFRPFVFEARNLTTAAASLETAVLMGLVAQTLYRARLGRLRRELLSSPILSGSLVFVLLFAVAVGLATKNLGSLSRYRMPMVPFYVLFVLLMRRRMRNPEVELGAMEQSPTLSEEASNG